MPSLELSPHDLDVLQKIKDPESAPTPVLVDTSLPRDPNLTNPSDYEHASSTERRIILSFQRLEIEIESSGPNNETASLNIQKGLNTCISELDDLISQFPKYASSYNNKAQALRRLYGDSILLENASPLPSLVDIRTVAEASLTHIAATIIRDLDTAISLLTPPTPFAPISTQAAKTLSQAYTQRGALYYATAKQMATDEEVQLRIGRGWSLVDLEEMASKDFAMGGRYGNEIARGLAVATNPTAKLCGNIVKEAMRKEFEGQSA